MTVWRSDLRHGRFFCNFSFIWRCTENLPFFFAVGRSSSYFKRSDVPRIRIFLGNHSLFQAFGGSFGHRCAKNHPKFVASLMSAHPMRDLFPVERRLLNAFTGLWQIIRDPDVFLESLEANLWSQTHGLSVFARCASDKFQEGGIETGNCWKTAILGYSSNRFISGDQHSLDIIYTFLQQILVKSTPVSFFAKCICIIRM